MNLKEGMRRLGLLLGVAGAIAGGFASYVELQTVLNQRARHDKFEQLANSDVVQQERKATQKWNVDRNLEHARTMSALPNGANEDLGWTPEFRGGISMVNKGGIGTIFWEKNYEIESFETEDGQTFYPTLAPAAWEYLLIALFPLFGFFIPWGAVRAIGWVGADFIADTK